MAAWKWIERQATIRPVKRVVFLYPTRATATEGYRRMEIDGRNEHTGAPNTRNTLHLSDKP